MQKSGKYAIIIIRYISQNSDLLYSGGMTIMKCPFCGYEDTKVIDSRPSDEKIRRRRECTQCGKRFTTYEVVERPVLMVVKKDGSYEPFMRDKVIVGIRSATKKRAVSPETIEHIVDDIENRLANEMRTEITTSEIGDSVLSALKDIDLVAYVRFASIYKEFDDPESFVKVITELGDHQV